jgi:hypothetical protein
MARLFVAGIRCFGMVELGVKPTKETRAELKEIFDVFSGRACSLSFEAWFRD